MCPEMSQEVAGRSWTVGSGQRSGQGHAGRVWMVRMGQEDGLDMAGGSRTDQGTLRIGREDDRDGL